jgi:hypothetical protein
MRSIALSLASLILLAGCATSGAVTDGFCVEAKPILVSKADVLTPDTARQVLAHNEYGAARCGWR